MSSHKSFIDQLTNQLEKWDYDLDRLEHRLNDISDELKEKLDNTVAQLKSDRKELIEKVQKYEQAGEDAIEDLKEGLDIAWDSIKMALLSAKSEFLEEEEEDS